MRRLIYIILAISLVLFLVYKIQKGFVQNIQSFNEDLPSTRYISSTDSDLISRKFQSEVKVVEVLNNKTRPSVALLDYSDYRIIMQKIIPFADFSLKNRITFDKHDFLDRSVGYTYSIIDNNAFKFEY